VVVDQWKLYAHHKVKLETKKNLGLARIFTLLGNSKHHILYDALHRLTKYDVNIKSRVYDQKNKLAPEQRYERLALGLNTWSRVLASKKRN